jgi:DNA-binding NtrC family response regulator
MQAEDTNRSWEFPAAPILVIDDDPRALSALDITLRSAGFENLVLCSDDRDVGAALGRAPYSLVILDLNTPLASANGILTMVSRLESMPLLVLAGTPWSRACRESLEGNAIDCLLKPVDRERLLAAVRRALGHEHPGGARTGQAT